MDDETRAWLIDALGVATLVILGTALVIGLPMLVGGG